MQNGITKVSKLSRIIAIAIAAVLTLSMVPLGAVLSTSAQGVSSFTVSLDGYSKYAEITLTDSADSASAKTVTTENGSAVFEGFVDDEKSYELSITGLIGYADYSESAIALTAGQTQYTVSALNELEKFELSGIVRDENNAPYSGAEISYSAYNGKLTGKTTTNNAGQYSFEAYKGQSYTLSAASSEEKYDTTGAVSTVTNVASDYQLGDFAFSIKQFEIATTATEGGTISAGETVDYGSDRTVTATAADGYRINSFTADGIEQTDAQGEKEYSFYFSDIKENHAVNVTYIRQTYKISFTVSGSGTVTYNDGTDKSVPGGSVDFEESTDSGNPTKIAVTATPDANYRVSSVTVDGTPEAFSENDKIYTTDFTMTKDHTFEAEFSLNYFSVETVDSANGTSSLDDNTIRYGVEYGENALVTIKPQDGYIVSELKINNGENQIDKLVSSDNNLTAEIEITKNTTISVTYAPATEKEPDNKLNNTYYSFDKEPVKQYTKDGTYVVVLPHDAEVTLTPASPYEKIKYNTVNQWDGEASLSFSDTIKIDTVLVKKNSNDYVILKTKLLIIIDKTAPKLEDIHDMSWTEKSTYTATGTATDADTAEAPSSGLSYVVWSELSLTDDKVLSETTNRASINEYGEYSFTIAGEQEKVYYVYAVDNSGNVSAAETFTAKIDNTSPAVTGFQISKIKKGPLEELINILTFGTFFNEQVEVTVTADDNFNNTHPSSGVKTITLLIDNIVFKEQKAEENKCTFTLPASEVVDDSCFSKQLSAVATDNVGNVTETAAVPTETNSNVKTAFLMLEKVKPTATIEAKTPPASDRNENTKDENDWYADDAEFTITASDIHSGLRNVKISINGKVLVNEDLNNAELHSKDYTVSTSQADINPDCSYKITAVITDNSGNTFEDIIKTVYKDTAAPTVTDFSFAGTGVSEPCVEATDYGFYFRDRTTVTVTANDGNGSGVKKIEYYTVDKDNGKSAVSVKNVDKNNQISFTVDANFKGQIYAKATDNVDNTAADYVAPNSTVVEKADKHSSETHITFTKAASPYRTNDGSELYNSDVPVTLCISDTYSGIRSIEWSVTAAYDTVNNRSGKVSIDNNKALTSDSDTGWSLTKTEQNIVCEMSKTITVSNNSNNITVYVKMTDRAGNSTEQQISLSIDKTKPVINVEYDNNTPDKDFPDYYKADREATVTVTERNFRAQDVVCTITNTDEKIPVLSEWTEHKNTLNPDATFYTATVLYHEDGDYTFDISCTDLAANAADAFTQQSFTIDETSPLLKVAYNNNTAQNGNYYAADRIATITITEHNFEEGRVTVTGTATDNGAAAAFPQTGTWHSDGDVHTATITYSSDSRYSFDISYTDKAGNETEDYTADEFYVDKTAPMLTISGVGDKSANNGDVIPVITCTDTNYDANALSVKMSGINNGETKVNGEYSQVANGRAFTFVNFERTKENDDIYTMSVKTADFAGNETEQIISFSVNRFGSVYTFDDSLTSIEGKYVRDEVDVVLTETNVDSLKADTQRLKMTKNGTASDLVQGDDYTVERSGGDGQWSQYKYTVKKSLFSGDGKYTVALYSEDAAGNVNENIDETKSAEISFGVDKTKPVVVPADFESDKQYPVESKSVTAEIKDNLVLDSVKIYLNDSEIEYETDGEAYTFVIAESNSKQNVRFVAADAAGNEYELSVNDFLVSTNIFARWFNNTPLFVGSIIGVAVIGLGITTLVVFGKRKKATK